ncbi:MAG: HIT family protein [Burkholderiales bacterium]
MSDCVFCRIVAGEIPASVVHEDDDTIAFMDIGSVNPGHVLVATKRHAENLFRLDEATGAAVGRALVRVARAVERAFAPEGLSQYQANGKLAGQTVFHFHVHLVPRRQDDGMKIDWPARNPARDVLEADAAAIRKALQQEAGGR